MKNSSVLMLFAILLIGFQLISAQKITDIKSSTSNEIENVTISLDSSFANVSNIKITSNIIELPISADDADDLPTELISASVFYEGNWLKLVYPEDFGVGYEISKGKKTIMLKAMNTAGLKQEARSLLAQKKFDGAINTIRSVLKVASQDGEAYYIGGLTRKAMAERDAARGNKRGAKDNNYYAAINFNYSKKYGYKPGQKKKTVAPPKKTPEKTVAKKEPAISATEGSAEDESDFSPWPFVIIIFGIVVLLFFLYGQKRTITIDDDDDLPSDTAFLKGLKKEKKAEDKKIFPKVEKKAEKKIIEKPFDPELIDVLQDGNDPDETIVYDEDISEIGPHDLIPEIDFDVDYPVIKKKKEETFKEEEADVINSVVKEIQREPTETSKKIKITASPEADDAALQVARKRLMELGSDKCRRILGLIGGGISMEEIANRENVSLGDVELVKQYLKIPS